MQEQAHSGYSLIELMTVLAVSAVLLAVAIPSFGTLIANNRVLTQANELVVAINTARSEAVRSGRVLALCPKSTPDAASTRCGAASGDWNNGWFIFVDTNGSTAGEFDGADQALRHWEPPTGRPSHSKDLTGGKPNYFRFTGTGAKEAANEETIRMAQSGTSSDQDRCIHVSAMGQVRMHLIAGGLTCP